MVYPDDREQALCLDHYISAAPIGPMEVAEMLDAPQWEWFTRTQERRA